MERDELELIEKFNYDFLSATRIGLDFPVTMYINDETHNAIMKLLQAYKQDEKVIEEMADAIYGEFYTPDLNTVEKIIDYFRKKCE